VTVSVEFGTDLLYGMNRSPQRVPLARQVNADIPIGVVLDDVEFFPELI
jgi:hypothetical protein